MHGETARLDHTRPYHPEDAVERRRRDGCGRRSPTDRGRRRVAVRCRRAMRNGGSGGFGRGKSGGRVVSITNWTGAARRHRSGARRRQPDRNVFTHGCRRTIQRSAPRAAWWRPASTDRVAPATRSMAPSRARERPGTTGFGVTRVADMEPAGGCRIRRPIPHTPTHLPERAVLPDATGDRGPRGAC